MIKKEFTVNEVAVPRGVPRNLCRSLMITTKGGLHWTGDLSCWTTLQSTRHAHNEESQSVSSVAQSCPTPCNPMDCSTPGLPVHRWLPVYSNSCPSSRWCHPAISSSVIPSSHLQSFPASGSFQMSPFFASGGQSIRVSASASVLPMNIQDWLPLGWTGWISLQSKGLSRVFSNFSKVELLHSSKVSILLHSAFFTVQLSHPYMTTGKTIALTRQTFVGKVMSVLFNMLSRLVIAFLPTSKRLLISQLAVTICSDFGAPPPKKILSLFPLFPHLFPMKWWGQMPWS